MILFENLQTMPQGWRSWPLEILRTYSRYINQAFHLLILIVSKCAILVFEGLLPDVHNKIIMDLLFEMATWHFLAKLRLHTESTLSLLKKSTTQLGTTLRKFNSVTCDTYVTKDLPSEEAARGRRQAALSQKKGMNSKQPSKPSETSTSPQERKLNLSAYKPCAIPDYTEYICLFGTMDGFTSQVVCFILSYGQMDV